MSSFQTYLDDLYDRYRQLNQGQVASYIPELAKANPDWFAISVVSTDGRMFEVGMWLKSSQSSPSLRCLSMAWS